MRRAIAVWRFCLSMTPRARRALFVVTFFFAVCALAGSLLEARVGAQSSQDESQLRGNLKQFTDVYALVEQNYADPISTDKADDLIYEGAIPGMLQVLDPHSHFYDPKSYARLREDQRGHYYGVGMLIQQQNDGDGKTKVIVVIPYEGTPSYRAGIHPGDQIVAIDGKTTEGWTSDQVAKSLKGPKGTHVEVGMMRIGQQKQLQFDLIRDEIPHPSIDLKFEIRPSIGYIHLSQFTETTGQEMEDAINGFGDLKGLVLDLRENPGGLLSQAVDVCDHLLSKGQTIVTQRGRAYSDQNYVATHGNGGKAFPIVVLVNRDTASAAEIVSGALQDHDRALIVGETTFGKGLVQTVYNLSENSGLALTTYHYYTPSGRLIQRNYEGVSLYDYYNHAGGLAADSSNREVKLTDAGRTVYGGGGITPDEKIEATKTSRFQDELYYKNIVASGVGAGSFAPLYLSTHTIDKNFQVDDAVIAEFKKYLTSQNLEWTEADLNASMDWLKARIRKDVITVQFGEQTGLRVIADWDPEIQKALGFMPEAQALEDNVHKVLAQKAQARAAAEKPAATQP